MRRELTQHLTQQRALFQDLQRRIGTLDALVFEHDTQQLDPTTTTATLKLEPQTTQTEIIRHISCAIVQPNSATFTFPTLENAWVQLGTDYLNVQSLLTDWRAPGEFAFILSSKDVRSLTVVAQADWPADTFLSFALFGEAIPTMDGGVLH